MRKYVKKIKRKNQRGYVLVLAMIGMMTLMFFLITGVSTTSTTVKVSGNYAKTVDSFNYAEVGLAKARPILEASSNFTTVLTSHNPSDSNPLIPTTGFNKGSYEVFIYDNDDGDGNAYADADNIVVVKSIGTNEVGGTVTIEAHLQRPMASPPTFPSQPSGGGGAAMLCGTASTVKTTGAVATISGHDYGLPTLPCSGASCAGTDLTSIDSTTYPGAYAVVGEGSVTTSGSGFESTFTPATQENVSDTQCDEWSTLRDQLASLDPSHPDVEVLSGSGVTAQLNDCTDPKVFIINTSSSTFTFSGTASLCGIVVVATDTALATVGDVVIIGTVLAMGESADLQFVASSGTPRIFGNVIVESTAGDTDREVEVKGNGEVNFSTAGMAFALQAMQDALSDPSGGGGSAIITMAWKETY